ncbi:phage holin family protein [Christiangramia sabulilitoris]|uniref:Phage holin family protein n=1 Tax=Christiangramia sabulilitoris TaxID=2583991 RepID=A0A550I2N4_9FLAO|nr:phage holin family protein [Christiangramia sabulilitoris]TRO65244.1 phage holin family protein [Christiangramia sabulilitoris]
MLQWLIHILVDAAVLLIAAKLLSTVHIKGFSTALLVALIIGVLSFLLSWLLTAILTFATLGIFYFLGIGFITRIIAFAIVIEIADKLTSDFKTDGFMASIWLAVFIALAGGILDAILF